MPESSGNIEEIHHSLKATLGRGHSDLDHDVVAVSKRVLLENIAFVPAQTPYTMQRDVLKAKYISLNPPISGWELGDKSQQTPKEQINKNMNNLSSTEKNSDGLPTPKVVLYPEEKVKMEWTRMTRIGAGLVNMGNTCFFNSTLQCLTYTAPLVNYCFSNDHRDKCKRKDFCMMCEIQSHIKSSLDCGGRSIKPHSILQKLRCIAKHMKWGRQEDAHEFLRFVVDHLQQSCLNGETKLDQFSKDTTVINQIFGGYLRSQVTCLRCHAKSNTFDPFMDISLDIKGVNTVEEALAKFVKPETLEQENAYKCPKCKHKVRAQKCFSIQKAPNVLTLQLNRFDFHRHLSGKINRFIKYPEKINLRSYMSQKQGEPIFYHLYGVLVHSGHSSEHGHYYSYVKSPSKTWYCMNDSMVHQAPFNNVFNADAYVLFYARINKNVVSSTSHTPPVKSPFIGPILPNHQPSNSGINGIQGKPTSELGTPIKRQESSSGITNGQKSTPVQTNNSWLPAAHTRISFPIVKPNEVVQDDGKRIVLQIKHGNSTTMEKSPDGKSKVVNGLSSHTALVPYNSDSEQEDTPVSVPDKKTQHQVSGEKDSKLATVSSSLSFSSKIATKMTGEGDAKLQAHEPNSLPSASSKIVVKRAGDGTSSLSSHDLPKPVIKVTGQGDAKTLTLESSSPSSSSTKLGIKMTGAPDAKVLSEEKDVSILSNKHSSKTPPLILPVSPSSSNKIKSTGGSWLIQSQDCAPSPRGSCSSSNSVNSTTEWTVESKEVNKVSSSVSDKCTPADLHKHSHTEKTVGSSSGSSSDTSSKKKKKHKKKSKKEMRDSYRNKKKHKKQSGTDYKKKSKYRKESSSESEDGYEWVEKTKETAPFLNNKVQPWNLHIKDDIAPKKENKTSDFKTGWDGSRPTKVATELQGDSFSFGSTVLSWEGGKNHIEEVVKSKKRHWSDDYNDDIDSGKVKKVKKVKETFLADNPFQMVQSDKIKAHGGSWNQDHRYQWPDHRRISTS